MARKGTPLYAVRKFCIECCGGSKPDVKTCTGDKPIMGGMYKCCPLFIHRLGRKRISVQKIRKHCLMCMGGSRDTVKDCPSKDCWLYPFRLGTNPNYKESTKQIKSKTAKKQGLSHIGSKSRAKKKVKK